jgi:hypothetical protein
MQMNTNERRIFQIYENLDNISNLMIQMALFFIGTSHSKGYNRLENYSNAMKYYTISADFKIFMWNVLEVKSIYR